jgi:2-polyprenyl-6-hydroxyphenyl methylase/3-demethylubiquinone-9 3-methyltransferase
MFDYYDQKLSAQRLKRAYQIAPPRVQQYLQAEIDHVVDRIRPGNRVLELGCGFGRVLGPMSKKAALAIGIDTSLASLMAAQRKLAHRDNVRLMLLDASRLGFRAGTFDVVACVQNGISAFHVDQRKLILESVQATRPGGVVLFSSYSDKFWDYRLEWFRLQTEAGLLGEIDLQRSRPGRIVCRDGFTATTVSPDQFRRLTRGIEGRVEIVEVDESSLFCEIVPHTA